MLKPWEQPERDVAVQLGGHHLYFVWTSASNEENYPEGYEEVAVSVTAGQTSYSSPRENLTNFEDYSQVEVGLLVNGELVGPLAVFEENWPELYRYHFNGVDTPVADYVRTIDLTIMIGHLSELYGKADLYDIRAILEANSKPDKTTAKEVKRFDGFLI
jgi:hypothetical protein